MASVLSRLAFWIWPPYEAQVANREIIARNHTEDADVRWHNILREFGAALPQHDDLKEIEGIAEQIQDSEAKRKETIEAKASSYASGITIAVSIITLASTLFADKTMPLISTILLSLLYLVSVIYLLAAAYSAIQARRAQAFATVSADYFLTSLKNGDWRVKERIVVTMGFIKWNEAALLCKSNWLSVAEDLFMRGIALASFSVLANMTLKIWIAVLTAQPISLPALFVIPTSVH